RAIEKHRLARDFFAATARGRGTLGRTGSRSGRFLFLGGRCRGFAGFAFRCFSLVLLEPVLEEELAVAQHFFRKRATIRSQQPAAIRAVMTSRAVGVTEARHLGKCMSRAAAKKQRHGHDRHRRQDPGSHDAPMLSTWWRSLARAAAFRTLRRSPHPAAKLP